MCFSARKHRNDSPDFASFSHPFPQTKRNYKENYKQSNVKANNKNNKYNNRNKKDKSNNKPLIGKSPTHLQTNSQSNNNNSNNSSSYNNKNQNTNNNQHNHNNRNSQFNNFNNKTHHKDSSPYPHNYREEAHQLPFEVYDIDQNGGQNNASQNRGRNKYKNNKNNNNNNSNQKMNETQRSHSQERYGMTEPIDCASATEEEQKFSRKLEETLRSFDCFDTEEGLNKRISILRQLNDLVKKFVLRIWNQRTQRNVQNTGQPRPLGKIYTFGSYRLGVHTKGADIDTLFLGLVTGVFLKVPTISRRLKVFENFTFRASADLRKINQI